MTIPDFQALMLPMLTFCQDQEEHSLRSSIEHLANQFELSHEERKHLLPSGQQAKFDNRVGWCATHLKKAKLLKATRRGYFRITDRGKQVLQSQPSQLGSPELVRI